MIADAAKLVCKICVPLYCQIKAAEYGITNCCDELDPKASIYLWILNSGCTISREMQCSIDDYLAKDKTKYTDPVLTDSNICGVNTTDNSIGVGSCSQTPTINVLL